jgi:hypothetical protein
MSFLCYVLWGFHYKLMCTALASYRIVQPQIEQVDGATFAFQQGLGLSNDGRNETLEDHLFFKETFGQGEQKLQQYKKKVSYHIQFISTITVEIAFLSTVSFVWETLYFPTTK